jgi:hypothetical protein
MRSPARIELHGEHTTSRPRQLGRQPAAARAEIQNEVARADSGVANQLRRKRPRAKEMLTTCAIRPARSSRAPLGHGPSP